MREFDAVIFDLDGVICFTDEYHYQAWKAMADGIGVYFDREINNRLRGVSRMASLEIVLEKDPHERSEAEKEALADQKNSLYKKLLAQMSPADLSDEVKATLDELRRRGYLLAIGSSSKNAPFILRQIGLDGYFDAVSDGNNITRSKPDPEVFLKAAEMLRCAPERCLVIEDAVSGAEAAHAGGMKAACVGDASRAGAGDYNINAVGDLKALLPPPEQEDVVQKVIGEFYARRMAQEKLEKLERFRHLNAMVRPQQILFVGSSLMEQFPIHELLLDKQLPYTIYNRGIGGYTTQELLETLDVCVYALQPRKIFINIGTNDLNEPDYSEDEIIFRYRRILREIRAHLPEAIIVLLAYYPVNPEAAAGNPYMESVLRRRSNERIAAANAAVKRLAEEMELTFADCNAGITDGKGQMRATYCIDGMHMYGDGYAPVLESLLPYLAD